MDLVLPIRTIVLRCSLLLFTALWFFAMAGCSEAPGGQTGEEGILTETVAARPAWIDDAVLYELFVPDFTEEGTFRAIIPRLGELKELGVTTIWLMPIHPIGIEERKGVLGSPYAVRDFYDVNPEYGTKEDFKALVGAVHAEGMYLILDLVANHTAWDHPWITEHPDWYTPGPDGGITVPLDPNDNLTDWTDVADLNYDNRALRAEMTGVMRYWVEEFDIDGYRCDVAGWVPFDFWKDAIAAVRQVKPVLMLAESEDPGLHRVGFDLTYAWPFYQTLKAVWEGAPVSELRTLVREVDAALPEGAHRLRFTTNHDETAWDATPPQLFGGQEGARAASVLAHTLPGVPLLYNGQETGQDSPVPFFEQTAYDWSQNPEMRTFYGDFFDLYAESAALRQGSFTPFAPDNDDVMLFARTAATEQLLVAVNTRPRSAAVTLPTALQGDRLMDVLREEPVISGQTLSLGPYDFRLLRVE